MSMSMLNPVELLGGKIVSGTHLRGEIRELVILTTTGKKILITPNDEHTIRSDEIE